MSRFTNAVRVGSSVSPVGRGGLSDRAGMQKRQRARGRARTGVSAVAVLASATLLVSACGSTGTKGTSGSASSGGSSGAKTLKIGMASVLSGPYTVLGELDNGAIAYLKYINAQGGVNGYRFSWQTADTAYTSTQSVSAARELASSGAQAIIGVGTIPTLAIKPIAAQLKVPIFLAGNGALYTPPVRNMFDISPDYDAMYPAIYALATKYATNGKVGVLYENDDIGAPAAQSIPKFVSAMKIGAPAAMVAAPGTVTDCTPYVAKLQAAGATAIELAMNTAPDACMVKAADRLGYSPKWVSNWGLESPAYASLLGTLFAGQHLLDYQLSLSSTAEPVVTYKKAMQQYDPKDLSSGFAEQGWDFGAVLVDAVRQVTANGKKFSQDDLLNALNTGFNGKAVALLPSVTFNSTEHYGTLSMGEFVTQGGGGHTQVGGFAPLPKPYGST